MRFNPNLPLLPHEYTFQVSSPPLMPQLPTYLVGWGHHVGEEGQEKVEGNLCPVLHALGAVLSWV